MMTKIHNPPPTGMDRMDKAFERIREDTNLLFNLVKNAPPDAYHFQLTPESWSPAQILYHLYLTEKLSLSYLKKKLSYPETVPPYSPVSWWGIFLVRLVFFTGYRIKAPKGINVSGVNVRESPEMLEAQWNQVRLELYSFLKAHYAQFHHHLVFRHAFAGRMTMYQMVLFFHLHMMHHKKQMEYRLRHFPGG